MSTLRKLRAKARRCATLEQHLKEALSERDELVRQAFEEGEVGEDIAKAANLSAPRVYQIKDGRN